MLVWYLKMKPIHSRSPGRVDSRDVKEVRSPWCLDQVYNLTVACIMTDRRLKQSRIIVLTGWKFIFYIWRSSRHRWRPSHVFSSPMIFHDGTIISSIIHTSFTRTYFSKLLDTRDFGRRVVYLLSPSNSKVFLIANGE